MSENFNEIINDIEEELQNDTTVSYACDESLNQIQQIHSIYGEQYDRRDELYADLLEQYIGTNKEKAKNNKTYKCVFFWITMVAFALLIIVPLLLFVIVACRDKHTYTHFAIVIGGVGSIASSIIILPRIIAEHLFPTNEDENMIGMVKNMQVNDSQIRTYFKKDDKRERNENKQKTFKINK